MFFRNILYFIFIQYSLLIPGYVVFKQIKYFNQKPAILLCGGYVTSIVIYAIIALCGYTMNINSRYIFIISWLFILITTLVFIYKKYYLDLKKYFIPLTSLLVLSILACAIVSINFTSPSKIIPDPEPMANRDYSVLNVKVLNISQTNANDNYVPYRQAQFMVNKLNPVKNSFIDEWGVHFFQRTPLMGTVTAFYFDLLQDKPPIHYLWSVDGADPSNTYAKFQIIAHILNSLLVVPAYFLLTRLFNKKTALVSLIFISTSHFFLYNTFFSWPKSFLAFFVLFIWILLLEDSLETTILAGLVSAMAYFTHDLAILYIGSNVVFLLYKKRFRDIVIILGTTLLAYLPWSLVSGWIYKKPSSFYLYPFSVDGIPQPGQTKDVLLKFINTSPLKLVQIRLITLYQMLTPYTLFESNRTWIEKLYPFGIFTVPGAVGLGMIIPSIFGVIKKIRLFPFWVWLILPIIFVALIFGWNIPISISTTHFAQPIIVILIGCGVWWLLNLKHNNYWLLSAYILNSLYFVLFILYSYNFNQAYWFNTKISTISVISIFSINVMSGILIYYSNSIKIKKYL